MTISQTISTLLGTFDLAVKAMNLRDDVKLIQLKTALSNQIFDVRQEALDLQEANTLLTQQKSELEREISRLKDHAADIAENYERWTAGMGAVVYRSKPGVATPGRTEYLCANCAADGQKTYLQPKGSARVHYCARGHGETIF